MHAVCIHCVTQALHVAHSQSEVHPQFRLCNVQPQVTLLNCRCAWLQVQAEEPLTTLAFRGRRTGTSEVRRKLATNAVMQNYKPPPTAPVSSLPMKSAPVQRTIDKLFKRQNAVTAADTAADMELL